MTVPIMVGAVLVSTIAAIVLIATGEYLIWRDGICKAGRKQRSDSPRFVEYLQSQNCSTNHSFTSHHFVSEISVSS